jgi:hypothetical protein
LILIAQLLRPNHLLSFFWPPARVKIELIDWERRKGEQDSCPAPDYLFCACFTDKLAVKRRDLYVLSQQELKAYNPLLKLLVKNGVNAKVRLARQFKEKAT